MAHYHDFIIIGAGPAGIQLAYFLQHAQYDYVILEGTEKAANFFRQQPRHRKLLSINKRFTGKQDDEFNLRHDWNSLLCDDEMLKLRYYSQDYFPNADDLVDYLEDFIAKYKLTIHYNAHITQVSQCPRNQLFNLKTNHDTTYQCRYLIIATGTELSYIPTIPGIELAIDYQTMKLEPKRYENKHILIIGKSNSALETADHLINYAATIHLISPHPIQFAWDTRFVGNVRAVNNNFFDTYHLKSQNAVIDGDIIKIWKNPDNNKTVVRFRPLHAPQEIEQLEYDIVLCCTGFRFNTEIFTMNCQPQLTACGKLPMMKPNFEAININNLFYAGTLTQALDHKKAQSAFIHGFRYNTRTLFHFLEERFTGKKLPITSIPAAPDILAKTLLKYLNHTSSLWQQVGFLADVLVPNGETLQWYHDLPYQYVIENQSRFNNHFYIVMFNIQRHSLNTFAHPRSSDVYAGEKNAVIHPLIEYYVDGKMVDKFHVLEDLLADWSGIEYVNSVTLFFKATLTGRKFIPPKNKTLSSHNTDKPIRNIIRDGNMKLKNAVI